MNDENNSNDKLKPCAHVRHGRLGSSCAACKLLKRRCKATCIFAPHFRSDELKKFAKVHKVFGASNVSKILVEVPEEQREDTVNSLVYEADARLCDPVYGCIGAIALLQRKMFELQHDLALARARLDKYVTTTAVTAPANCPAVVGPLQPWGDGGFVDQVGIYGGDGGCNQHGIGRSLCQFVHDQPHFPFS